VACCDKYYAAIDFYKASLGISLEIGTQWENATLLFNLGYAYIRIDRAWEALEAYQNALQLYRELGLDKKVEECESAIRDINTMVVAEPRSAPPIGNIDTETPKQRKSRRRRGKGFWSRFWRLCCWLWRWLQRKYGSRR